MSHRKTIAASAASGLLALSVSGCVTNLSSVAPPVPVTTSDGRTIGSVTFARNGSALIAVTGLAPGEHGLHLHEKGVCEGPAFTSAGGHWNPAGHQHGRDNPAGAHAGDLPNLFVDTSGRGVLRVTFQPGSNDADGAALVIHAKPDDYRTDPSGASGDRIACAVLYPPKG